MTRCALSNTAPRRPARWPGYLALLLLCIGTPAPAIERLHLAVGHLEQTLPDGDKLVATGLDATLRLQAQDGGTRIEMDLPHLALPQSAAPYTGALTQVHVRCDAPVIREPMLSCPRLQVRLRAARWPGMLSLEGGVQFDSDTGQLQARGQVPGIAGATLTFELQQDDAGLRADLALPAVQIPALRELAAPWVALPPELALQGTAHIAARLEQQDGQLHATLSTRLGQAGFQNADYTWIGEHIDASFTASANLTAAPYPVQLRANGGNGQLLGGTVLLDLQRNPLQLQVQGHTDGRQLAIETLQLRQENLLSLSATARIGLDPFTVTHLEADIPQLQFPDAYGSYLQLLLATTPFGQLQATGTASARLVVDDDLPTGLTLRLDTLGLLDASRQLAVRDVNGELHWSAGATGPPRPSYLSWESATGWGIESGATRLDFAVDDRNFRLLQPVRLPLFDGAVFINTLRGQDIGLAQMEGDFDAIIEPISLAPLARAMGWPAFSGKLAGRIPGLTYRNGVLDLAGSIEANVFDGHVSARNLSVEQPFSAWPQLHADITARNLDLDLITHTFDVGSITGRLDVDLLGLATFNWSPVAFDLRLATPPGDRSRRRISQRAVESLSSVGGNGGGVAAALQSGFLRFFDDFGYRRLGISCRLRDDVCRMDGAGRAGEGFYIVRGSGLPRLNIIGNGRQVDWPRLMAQIAAALDNSEGFVVN